ncbi:hypothetical protein AC578_1467 [Pseudocercospora eumusae]|uniref:Uncharacterized protein n=1 Tax=Pseudocercospora eumusae TaxID=321146 RepID=A0A139H6I6_9PEZI|nr:hypothetical protein AC578_1467 [Pseudocercospora eumusae]
MSPVRIITAITSDFDSDTNSKHDKLAKRHQQQPQNARVQSNNQSAGDEHDTVAANLVAAIDKVDSEETLDTKDTHDHARSPSHLKDQELEALKSEYIRDSANLEAQHRELHSREAIVTEALWREFELPPSQTSGKFSTAVDLLIHACRELRREYTDAFELWRQKYIFSELIDRVMERDHTHPESVDREARKSKSERDWARIEAFHRERSDDERSGGW